MQQGCDWEVNRLKKMRVNDIVLYLKSIPDEEADDEDAADDVESAVRLEPIGIADAVTLAAVLAEPVVKGCATMVAVLLIVVVIGCCSLCEIIEVDDKAGCKRLCGADNAVGGSVRAIARE